LEIILDLPFGFPINNIISLDLPVSTSSCLKNHCKDISMSSAAAAIAIYYYEDPGPKYEDVKIKQKRFQDLIDKVNHAEATAAYIQQATQKRCAPHGLPRALAETDRYLWSLCSRKVERA